MIRNEYRLSHFYGMNSVAEEYLEGLIDEYINSETKYTTAEMAAEAAAKTLSGSTLVKKGIDSNTELEVSLPDAGASQDFCEGKSGYINNGLLVVDCGQKDQNSETNIIVLNDHVLPALLSVSTAIRSSTNGKNYLQGYMHSKYNLIEALLIWTNENTNVAAEVKNHILKYTPLVNHQEIYFSPVDRAEDLLEILKRSDYASKHEQYQDAILKLSKE